MLIWNVSSANLRFCAAKTNDLSSKSNFRASEWSINVSSPFKDQELTLTVLSQSIPRLYWILICFGFPTSSDSEILVFHPKRSENAPRSSFSDQDAGKTE